jgi:uncharacterized membrane protein YgcG
VPKAFGKEIPTWMLIGAGACAIMLAYKQFSVDDTPPASTAHKAKKTSAKTNDLYTEADTKAHFAVYNEPPKNAFHPLLSSGPVSKGLPGGLATSLTGGEANWFYTGSIEVDGRAQALLENTSTGESVYLARGEKFKNVATLQDIQPDKVVFLGPEGKVEAKLNDPTELKRGPGVLANGGVAPMNPGGFTGQIGGQLPGLNAGIDPNTGQPSMSPYNNGMTVQTDPNQGGGFGRGRGRGGRGGRGGGGGNFGGGGFGN